MICFCHIRLRRAMASQKIPDSELPFRGFLWPYGTYIGFGGSIFFIIFQGWTSFVPWDTKSFFMNYIVLILFFILTIGWKLWHRTKWVKVEEADMLSGRRNAPIRELELSR